jgi:hypothetical protein
VPRPYPRRGTPDPKDEHDRTRRTPQVPGRETPAAARFTLLPFDQLARPVFAFTAAELATGRPTRFEGAKVEVGRIPGLTRRGWERATVVSGGTVPGMVRALPGGVCAMLVLDPGFYAGAPSEDPEQRIAAVFTAPAETRDPLKAAPPGPVDPVAASETPASIASLTRTT